MIALRQVARVAALLIVVSAPAFGADSLSTPEAVAKAFYRTYFRQHVYDIPDAAHSAAFKPLFTTELFSLLVLAEQGEVRYAKKNAKEPAPPLFEGDLFSSMVEGATSVTHISCERQPKTAVCTTTLHRLEQTRTKGQVKDDDFTWKDRLLLVRTAAGWRIDNLEYGLNGDFGPKGDIKKVLNDVDKLSRED
jgi:hypothetical protein